MDQRISPHIQPRQERQFGGNRYGYAIRGGRYTEIYGASVDEVQHFKDEHPAAHFYSTCPPKS